MGYMSLSMVIGSLLAVLLFYLLEVSYRPHGKIILSSFA